MRGLGRNIPARNSRSFRKDRARERQKTVVEGLKAASFMPRNPRVPISVKIRASSGEPAHVFSAPVNGEISNIRIAASPGNPQGKASLRLSVTNKGGVDSEDITIEQGTPFEMFKTIRLETGDELSIQSRATVTLIATMMFREN